MYPEHDKLAAGKNQSQEIGDFLEWLSESGVVMCKWHDARLGQYWDSELEEFANTVDSSEFLPIHETVNELLARYFGIDLDVLEQENWEMLEGLRSKNE